ncbi:hypothetical protein Prum_080380 [Phytohabitans rumicis]|uniref:Uncharacterized protein n=1 Tax=Phytohabitans rumicis TaxID=1076125 RepID=A0A6V8LJP3_9ACTN|nr:hypothetical protein Prum_080380 [Phytohabitans rumicis]
MPGGAAEGGAAEGGAAEGGAAYGGGEDGGMRVWVGVLGGTEVRGPMGGGWRSVGRGYGRCSRCWRSTRAGSSPRSG